MSLLRMSKNRKVGSTWGRIRDSFFPATRRCHGERKSRRLRIDPLEERTLLSVSPADVVANLVNSVSSTGAAATVGAQSVAMDENGDFVVAWTRTDLVYDSLGDRVIDPETEAFMVESNVYARYFTNEVQQIVLPDDVLLDDDTSSYATADIAYGGNEVQLLTFTSATWGEIQEDFGMVSPIAGSFKLWLDVNVDGVQDVGEVTDTIGFNETIFNPSDPAADNQATLIQDALQALGGDLADVVVTGIDSQNYTISFGDASGGVDQDLLVVVDQAFGGGNLASASVSPVLEPFTITFVISPDDPSLTAHSIEDAFQVLYANRFQATTNTAGPDNDGVNVVRTAIPTVSVTSVKTADDPDGLRTFNIELTGDSALTDVPTMVVSSVVDEDGNVLVSAVNTIEATTIKEPSPEFRVNPEEPDNPFTALPDKYNQYNACVAMDADGDFIIAWEGEIPNSHNSGSVTDIFARLFQPVGIVDPGDAEHGLGIWEVDLDNDGVDETQIQGVRPVEVATPYSTLLSDTSPFKVADDLYTFRANEYTTNAQSNPSVAMDSKGNFAISWSSGGQDISYFNSIFVRSFSSDGSPVNAVEVMVNEEVTDSNDDSFVALSDNGYYVVAWVQSNTASSRLDVKLYDPDCTVALDQFEVVSAGSGQIVGPSAAFDTADNFFIGWTQVGADQDNNGLRSIGYYACEYDVTGVQIRDTLRANSANLNANTLTSWPLDQYNGQVVMDADGDLTIIYEGFGPDVSENAGLGAAMSRAVVLVQELFLLEENADLVAVLPVVLSTAFTLPLPVMLGGGNTSGDVDGVIEEMLIMAFNNGATQSQIGRMYAIFNGAVGLLRGEADGIMYSQFDTDPNLAQSNILNSDTIVNSLRDGNNTRFAVSLSLMAADGDFTFQMTNDVTGQTMIVTLQPVYLEDVLLPDPETTAAFEAQMEDALSAWGINWNRTDFEGLIDVRYMSAGEATARNDSYWPLQDFYGGRVHSSNPNTQHIWEFTFQGELHDTSISMALVSNSLANADGDLLDELGIPPPEFVGMPVYTTSGLQTGTVQHNASVAITADGDFVVVYTEDEKNAAGQVTNQNIYYRFYDESTETAGPTVASVETTDGQSLDGTQVYESDGVTYIVLSTSEKMYDNATSTGDAVTNTDNYVLYDASGDVIEGAVAAAYYGLNKVDNLAQMATDDPATYGGFSVLNSLPSNKYEIVLVIDANGTAAGVTTLGTSTYTLELLSPIDSTASTIGYSGLRDAAGTPLNRTGYVPDGENTNITFSLIVGSDDPNLTGTEILVNDTTTGVQTTSSTYNLPAGTQYNNRTVAVDNDGDYVVVWISHGQDGDSDSTSDNYDENYATSAGVYMQLFNSEGHALTAETLVNTHTIGDQTDCAVAIDADGDFVVVWVGEGQDSDGSSGIYGQRFDSMGWKLGGEFQVNTNVNGDQISPSVAMDSDGNFVVAWASVGQAGSNYYHTIRAQTYNSDGVMLTSEIAVNDNTMSDVSEAHPQVALSDSGYFVATWSAPTVMTNGVVTDTGIVMRLIGLNGATLSAGTLVNTSAGASGLNSATLRSARNAQVAVNSASDLAVVVWEGYSEDNEDYDIYGRYYQIAADGALTASNQFQANVTIGDTAAQNYSLYAGDQVNASVAIDANENFIITWNGNGIETNALDPANALDIANADTQGVWARTFTTSTATSTQERINVTSAGYQGLASVGMTTAGDAVVVWSGNGSGDTRGVYAKIVDEPSDTAGPMMTDFLLPDGTPVAVSGQVTQPLYAVMVSFDEELLDNVTHTGDAATNPANYALLIDGVEIAGGISQVFFGLDKAHDLSPQYGLNAQQTNKYQAVLIVDANGASAGVEALTDGRYQIAVKGTLRDKAGNPLLSTGENPSGAAAVSDVIYVNVPTGQETLVSDGTDQIPPQGQHTYATTADSVASDADGDYVVAWTDATPGQEGVWIRMYEQVTTLETDGTRTTSVVAGNEIRVSSDATASDISVARDVDGDFVVTWSAWNATTNWDVYAQLFNVTGQAEGSIFRVNSHTTDVQRFSAVDMDSDGDFIITWQSNDQDGSGYGIYAQRYFSSGAAVGGASEIQEIDFIDDFTGTFKLRWDHDNNPATSDRVTAPISYTGDAFATAVDVQSALTAIGADVEAYDFYGSIDIYFVGDSGNKDQAPLWVSPADVVQTGGGADAEVMVWTFANGQSGESLVNDTTAGDQMYADVAMDAAGNCVVTWTTYGQGGDNAIQTNVYAKRLFVADDAWTTGGNEFIVNADDPISADAEGNPTVVNNRAGNQSHSSVAMDLDGDFVVTWTSYGQDRVGDGYGSGVNGLNGVFARRFTAEFDPTVAFSGVFFLANRDQASNAFQVNQTAEDNQQNARVSMDADGDFTIAWESDQNGDFDVYIRRYARTSEVQYANSQTDFRLVGQNPFLGSNGEIGGEVRINTTLNGDQRFPGVALDDTGDAVIVWSGNGETAGQEDSQGIFLQRLARPADDAGPTVSNAELVYEDGFTEKVYNDMVVYDTVDKLVLTFGEALSTRQGAGGVSSILNPSNWQLLRGNSSFSCDIVDVQYGSNLETGKYEAVITVDGNSYADGDQPLGNGTYAITLSDAVQDIFGNPLDGDYDGTPGGAYSVTFTVDLSDSPYDPGVWGDMVTQSTSAARSVAMDDDGDFVIVYTRDDPMLDTDGTTLLDPVYGGQMYGTNIYATYYTEGVQRITLPEGVLTDALAGQYGKFSLVYGGNEVQKISFSQATPSLGGASLVSSIDGMFSLWFDVNWDGMQDPGEVTAAIDFHEMAFNSGDPNYDPAIVMQSALRGLGGALSDVVVEGTDADNYLINFGDASLMQVQPQLMVVDQMWYSGFLPAAQISVVSEPIELGVSWTDDPTIPVSPTNGALTAAAIEQAFLWTTYTSLIAPDLGANVDPANDGPWTRTSTVKVIATPVQTAADPNGLRTFDIMFVEDSAYKILPPLVIPAGQAINEAGVVLSSSDISAVIKKQTSAEFRVNPEVPVNPFQLQPDECYNPSVAMDADGSFVIAWAAAVSDLANPGSVSDVFARRFEPVGMVSPSDPGLWQVDMNNDGVAETAIQGVRPVEAAVPYNSLLPADLQVPGDLYTFRVNTDTTNAQDQSSVAMDHYGNFVVVWSGYGQDTSFFNTVYAQQYAYDGTPIGQEVMVNHEDTSLHFDPFVTMSEDGHWLVVWTRNTNYEGHDVDARLFDAVGDTLIDQWNVQHIGIGGPTPTAAFDAGNNFIISWTEYRDRDNIPGDPSGPSQGVYFREYSLDGTVLRTPDQRANSGLRPNQTGVAQMIGLNPDDNMAIWSGDQYGGQIVMDADGDITVSYEGFGPAIAETAGSGLGTSLMNQLLNMPENADLVAAWPGLSFLSLPYGQNNSGDADSIIEEVLIQAQKYHNFSDEQLGRLSAIMNLVLTMNRGEANGIMYAQFDADPILGPQNVLASDNVVNEQRDGTNTRYVLTLEKNITSGDFTLRITNGLNREDITIAPVYTDAEPPAIDAEQTRGTILAALQACVQELGINWPTEANGGGQNGWLGPVTVRLLSDQEIIDREGTYWDLDPYGVSTSQYVYEVTFLGEVHNTTITLGPPPGSTDWNQLEIPSGDDTVPAPNPLFVVETSADTGTLQHSSSIAVTPAGNYIVAWTQDTLDSTGFLSNQEIQYRIYTEITDTAGPQVANWYAADGTIIEDGGTVYDPEELQHIIISFTEAMLDNTTHTGDAVTNPANYALWYNDVKVNGAIVDVQYGMNKAADLAQLPGYSDLNSVPTNHWEVILMIDANGSQSGSPVLSSGDYILEALAPAMPTELDPVGRSGLRDRAGNALGRNGFQPEGTTDSVTFTVVAGGGTDPGDPPGTTDPIVNTTTIDDQNSPAVASDAEGNHVVVWVSYDHIEVVDPDADEDDEPVILINANIKGQRFDSTARPVGLEFTVNSFTDGNQFDPAVAMDADGNFVVVWSGQGQGDLAGVYGRAYDNLGLAVSDDFRVNQTIVDIQDEPAVAMDADGDFVVTWTSYGQDGDLDGIYARRFTVQGVDNGDEILVNTTWVQRQDNSDVAMDDAGNFVVTWKSDQQDGNSWGIYGQRFAATGAKLGGEFRTNTYTLDDQINPAVAMDADGDFIVAWSSMGQDGSGYGIYARRYNPAGAAKTASEFRANQTTLNWQVTPDVGMAANGMFAVTWSAFGQDNITVENPTYDYGIYARMFNPDGSDYKSTATGTALGEFRVNSTTRGNQFDPAIAISDDGDLVVTWTGPDQTDEPGQIPLNTDIFSRVITSGSTATSQGPVISSVVVSQADGVITWNAADGDGVAGASIVIDGVNYNGNPSPVDSSSVNFWKLIGNLSSGDYDYTITAVDNAGNSSQLPGLFTLTGGSTTGTGPLISSVVVSEADGVMTWNAADADGVASAYITIDGVNYSGNPSPESPSSVNFWKMIDVLSAGDHDYTITAVDTAGNSSQLPGSFTLTDSSSLVSRNALLGLPVLALHKRRKKSSPLAARNALFSGVGRSGRGLSVELDWLYDSEEMESLSNAEEPSSSLVDAVMATY